MKATARRHPERRDMKKEKTATAAWDVAAAALTLVTPAFIYVTHHDYSYLAPEVLAFFGLLAAAGAVLGAVAAAGGRVVRAAAIGLALTLFMDIEFKELFQAGRVHWSGVKLAAAFLVLATASWFLHQHVTRIVAGIMATVLVATLVMPPKKVLLGWSSEQAAAAELPVFIHIILDEHQGIEGIPTSIDGGAELKKSLKAFFEEQGFRLFGKAYSNTNETRVSLSRMLNMNPFSEDFVRRGSGGFKWEVPRPAFFEGLRKQGYRVNVYQSDNTNFCANGDGAVSRCHTYAVTSIKHLEEAPLSLTGKLRVILSIFVEPSYSYKIVRRLYRLLNLKSGSGLPEWTWERSRVTPISGFLALEKLRGDLLSASRGDYYFAHVVTPHFPYIFDGQCRMREPAQWLRRYGNWRVRWNQPEPATANTPETRRLRYQRYFEQTRCLYARLTGMFAALKQLPWFADAIIILQSDHGSRITLHDPDSGRSTPLPAADRIDSHATLFAIRAPGISAGYDRDLRSTQELFAGLVAAGFRSIPVATATDHLLGNGRDPQYRMIDFGEGSEFQP